MKYSSKFWCTWDNLFAAPEKTATANNRIISLQDSIPYIENGKSIDILVEIGIFIGKSDDQTEFEVLVVKMKDSDTYVPNELDNANRIVENNISVSFFFGTFQQAIHFANTVLPLHKEFADRPIAPITFYRST